MSNGRSLRRAARRIAENARLGVDAAGVALGVFVPIAAGQSAVIANDPIRIDVPVHSTPAGQQPHDLPDPEYVALGDFGPLTVVTGAGVTRTPIGFDLTKIDPDRARAIAWWHSHGLGR